MRSRAEVLKSARQIGPKGEDTKANLAFWSERASANSYHGPSSRETKNSRLGPADKNHAGDSSFMPGVRRES